MRHLSLAAGRSAIGSTADVCSAGAVVTTLIELSLWAE